jgi:hypothetical protein
MTIAHPAPPSTREQRGLELYRSGGLERIAPDLYIVPSRTTRRVEYLVDVSAVAPSCECADHKRSGGPCFHAYAAMLYRARLRRAARIIAPVLAADHAGDDL